MVSTTKKILLATLAIVVIAGASLGGYRYTQRGVVKVQTGRIIRQDLVSIVTASGEIKPRNYINIGANSMGRITDIYVREGDVVEEGQRLAKLETARGVTRFVDTPSPIYKSINYLLFFIVWN